MNKNNIGIIGFTLLTLLSLAGCLSSESQAKEETATAEPIATTSAPTPTHKFIEGKHYVEIFPEINTDVKDGQVEVLELFWLGCPHCEALEPTMKSFQKTKPDYVTFKQVPAVLNPGWSFHAKAFYVAKILDPKDTKDLIGKLFHAIHKENKYLNKPDALKAFFLAQGYTASQFDNTFNSMALIAAMSNAKSIGEASQAGSVPTLIINGKYRTSPYMAGGEENLIKIVDMLIQQEKK